MPSPSPARSIGPHRGSGLMEIPLSMGQCRRGQRGFRLNSCSGFSLGCRGGGEWNCLSAVNALKQHSEPVQPEIWLLLQPGSGAISHLSVPSLLSVQQNTTLGNRILMLNRRCFSPPKVSLTSQLEVSMSIEVTQRKAKEFQLLR